MGCMIILKISTIRTYGWFGGIGAYLCHQAPIALPILFINLSIKQAGAMVTALCEVLTDGQSAICVIVGKFLWVGCVWVQILGV